MSAETAKNLVGQESRKDKNKIIFTGFSEYEVDDIKDILHKRQNIIDIEIVFESDLQEVRDIVASDFVDIMAIFINISSRPIDGIAGVCGYIASVVSLVQDATESDISIAVSCPIKGHVLLMLFDELYKKPDEDFRVVGDMDTKHLPALIESIKKNRQQKYATV